MVNEPGDVLYNHNGPKPGLSQSNANACVQVATTPRQLHAFLEGTLFGVQQRKAKETDTWKMTRDQLNQLAELGLVRATCVDHAVPAEDRPLEITRLGQATWKGVCVYTRLAVVCNNCKSAVKTVVSSVGMFV